MRELSSQLIQSFCAFCASLWLQDFRELCQKSPYRISSLCNLCVLCASVVKELFVKTTTETRGCTEKSDQVATAPCTDPVQVRVPIFEPSIHNDPFQTRGEEFLFRIDRHDVCAESADATIWTKGDLRHETGIVLVESFESGNQSLPT